MNSSSDSLRRKGNKTIAVILGKPEWTAKAIHLACALAHSHRGEVILVKLIPVQHPMDLGTAGGYVNFSRREQRAAREWMAIARDYNTPCKQCVYQYASYVGGVTGVAAGLDAAIVLAEPIHSWLPFWGRFQQWRLRLALAEAGRSLETLQPAKPGSDELPYINLIPEPKPSSSGK
jgi:hypothetical protein